MKVSFYKLTKGTSIKSASLGVLTLLLLGVLNPTNPGYVGVSPHPYLLIACFLGVTLGLRNALILCGLISAAYLKFLEQSINWRAEETLGTLKYMLLPIAMTGVPAALGALSDRWRLRNRDLEVMLERQKKFLATLDSLNKRMRKEKEVAEARTMSQLHTIAQVFGYAQSLETTDVGEIADILVDIACSQLNEDNCYVYLLENEELVLRSHRDASARELPERIPASEYAEHPLISRAMREKRLVRPAPEEEKSWREVGLLPGMVTPLTTPWGQLVGVIAIRRLQFINCHSSFFAVFEAIGKWGGVCLARAMRLSAVREATYRDEVTGLFSHRYFARRIQSEFQLARHHGLNLYVVEFRVREIRQLETMERYALLRLLADAVERASRPTDTITTGIEPGSFNTIMTIAEPKEVDDYIQRVQAQFDSFRRPLQGGEILSLQATKHHLQGSHSSVDEFLSEEAA